MPFTLSHPAAVLLFPKAWGLERSALVVGSMSPDFIYFMRLRPAGDFGHTFPGLLLFCLPVGFLAFWLVHTLLKRPFYALLPYKIITEAGEHKAPLRLSGWRFAVVAFSLILGALTHIAWDAFTHESGWGVKHSPWLQTRILPQSVDVPGYKLAQHGSSLIGLAVIVSWFVRQQAIVQHLFPLGRAKLALGLLLFGGSGTAGLLYSLSRRPETFGAFLGTFVVTALTSLFVAVCLYALLWHARHLKR